MNKTQYRIGEKTTFSRSLIWKLQRQYFFETGVNAWRENEVPHYVVSNPIMARSYGEIIFGLYLDLQRIQGNRSMEPITIIELGAGSGRFGFHLLSVLNELCLQYRIPQSSFRFLLSDFTQNHLDYYLNNSYFQSYFKNRVLDVTIFDVEKTEELELQFSGKLISRNNLHKPIVVIANYLFDTIPQDLFYINNGNISECLIHLATDTAQKDHTAKEILADLKYRYEYREIKKSVYEDSLLQTVFEEYRKTIKNSHILIPTIGMQCIKRLKSLSKSGLILLSADKGMQHLDELEGKPAPNLIKHGSFSLSVNYHALASMFEYELGEALFPDHKPDSVIVSCMLNLKDSANYINTKAAYAKYIKNFGPDDFYTITKHSKEYIPNMSVRDILAYLRLTYHDAHQFSRYLPRLRELANQMSYNEARNVIQAVDRVWKYYYPLGESQDLAFEIGILLYELNEYKKASRYFQYSNEIYGEHSGTLFNMAMCFILLEEYQIAQPLLSRCIMLDPQNKPAHDALNFTTSQILNVNQILPN